MTPEPPAIIAPAPNAVFFEPLGNGLLYSINYERFLGAPPLGLRAGASFFTWKVSDAAGSGNLKLATFPFVASYYLDVVAPRHKLQLGLGATVIDFSAATDATGTQYSGNDAGLKVAMTGVVGYRFVPRGGGFTFGAGFTPLFRFGKGFLPWGGANAGWMF